VTRDELVLNQVENHTETCGSGLRGSTQKPETNDQCRVKL